MDLNNNNFENGEFSQKQTQGEQQNAYGNAEYTQPVYVQPTQPVKDETVSVLDWVGTILLSCVPCVGLIVYIIWAFSKDTKKSKANFCKAQLIIMLAMVIIYIILIVVLMVAGVGAAFSEMYY